MSVSNLVAAAPVMLRLRSALSDLFVPLLVATCSLGLLVFIAIDQIALLPPRPPTLAEEAAARPAATTEWRRVYGLLLKRLPVDQVEPPQVGAVWATRDGQVCGLIEVVGSSVPYMEPFYTVDGSPRFKSESLSAYVENWMRCGFDQWVMLHFGSYKTGFCATRAGRNSVLGRKRCAGWATS